MPYNRFFIDQDLHMGSKAVLQGDEFHHLVHVIRAKASDELELINGKGILADAKITEITKDRATCLVFEVEEQQKLPFHLILALGMLKMSHLEIAIEKATELGIDEIWLFESDKSEKKSLSPNGLKRLSHIVFSATKQSGRLYLPKLCIKKDLAECLLESKNSFYGSFDDDAKSLEKISEHIAEQKTCTFFIGPESGFSKKEIQSFKQKGSIPFSLHPNTLRAETAAITATYFFFHSCFSSFKSTLKK